MILYVDTSALIPLVVGEAGSGVAMRLWSDADRVVSSRLVYVEAHAALAMANRIGRLDAGSADEARHALEILHDEVDLVACGDTVVRRAAELARALDLRGYDAVHCASAELIADPDLVVAAGDRAVLAACSRLGLATADTSGTA